MGSGWNVRMVDRTNTGLLYQLIVTKYQAISFNFSADGKLFATGDADGIIRVYGSGQGVPLFVVEGHMNMVNTFEYIA